MVLISIALGGQPGTQRPHTLHFLWLKTTLISGRLIDRAPVGQTAVHAPQWVHLFLLRPMSWPTGCTRTPCSFKYRTPLLKSFFVPDSSRTMIPSLRGSMVALRILNVRLKSVARKQTIGFSTSVFGNCRTSILEYILAPLVVAVLMKPSRILGNLYINTLKQTCQDLSTGCSLAPVPFCKRICRPREHSDL